VGDHPYALVTACLGLGYAHKVKGDYRQSLSILERGRSLSRDWSLTLLSPLITWHIGHACALGGRVSEGLSLLQAALEAHEAAGVGVFHSLMVAHAGEVYALAGRLDEAFRLARRALTLARERRERAHEAYALRLHGDVVAFTEPLDRDAGSYYRQALVLADELGMRPLVAHCHLGLGKLYSRTGDAAKATEHLTTAATMYRETGMTFWLEKGDAELGGAER
jgi:tetratricopeptide (TPR) repeat protein